VDAGLAVAIGALIAGPLLGFLAATRRLSGKIGTSDAAQLWEAAESMRKEYRDDLQQANQRVVNLETRVGNLEQANNELSQENMNLKRRVYDLEIENGVLRKKVTSLEHELHEERNGRNVK
jgi:predicted RNase H-like nuclease (RuvC/YqgF family)